MLILRTEQLNAFSDTLWASFLDRAAGYARRTSPGICEAMGEERLHELIRRCAARAGRHGALAERDVCRYLVVALAFGADFEDACPWAAEILASPHAGGPAEAMFLIHAEAASRAGGGVPSPEDAALGSFALRPVGGCVEGPAPAGDIAFDLADARGLPFEGDFVLEHPDGTLEPGRFWKGRLYRSGVSRGACSVHFPAIVGARWERQRLPLGEVPCEVGLILAHFGLRAGTEVAVAIHRTARGRDPEPCAELVVRLAGDDRRLLEEQETRAAWVLEEHYVPPDGPRSFTFTASLGRQTFPCASPLVLVPAEELPSNG